MRKIKVVISGIHYPLSMMKYFIRAFQRRKDVELFTVGPYTGDFIPWAGGMRIPNKYIESPDVALPVSYINQRGMNPSFIEAQLPWEPDLWIQIDAGWWLRKPKATVVAHIATDPHVLNYDEQRRNCDIFFSMQMSYMKNGDRYLPYAVDPLAHYPIALDKKYDGCLIGLHYENRNSLVNALRNSGYEIYYSIGEIFDEFTLAYNESRVALNWSSLNDLNARTFEALGMSLALLTNRVSDLSNFFVEGEHYLGFDNVEEAKAQFKRLIDDPAMAEEIAFNGYRKVMAAHTYDHRIEQILESCKLLEAV